MLNLDGIVERCFNSSTLAMELLWFTNKAQNEVSSDFLDVAVLIEYENINKHWSLWFYVNYPTVSHTRETL